MSHCGMQFASYLYSKSKKAASLLTVALTLNLSDTVYFKTVLAIFHVIQNFPEINHGGPE